MQTVTEPTTYTIGYEGMSVDSFIACLRTAKIDHLIDIREIALSRKRGFSKTALAGHLQKAGIRYSHVRALGCPKEIRDKYREDGNWARYARAFKDYMKTQTSVLNELSHILLSEKCSLMCFEADFSVCHRSLVTEKIGGKVVHLTSCGTV